MKFSLIVTVYNNSHLLRKNLISLRNQSLQPDELIISDDGSSEDIFSLLKNLPFPVKLVKQADLGFRLSRSRNNAVRVAKHDFLLFIDQDIVLTKDFIKTMLKNAKPKHFVVGLPIRLDESQSEKIDDEMIKSNNYRYILTDNQKKKIVSQYRKDKFYCILKKMYLREKGVKLRGGLLGVFKNDYLAVNGYDENYVGWGSEDDDLGYRLRALGVTGINPFIKEYAMHLYHPINMTASKSLNRSYLKKRKYEITKNSYRCEYGIDSPKDKDKVEVIRL